MKQDAATDERLEHGWTLRHEGESLVVFHDDRGELRIPIDEYRSEAEAVEFAVGFAKQPEPVPVELHFKDLDGLEQPSIRELMRRGWR